MRSTLSLKLTHRHHETHDSSSALNGESEHHSPGEALSPTGSPPSSSPVANSVVDGDTEEGFVYPSQSPSCELTQIGTAKHRQTPDNKIKFANSDACADQRAKQENESEHCGTSAATSSIQESSAPVRNRVDVNKVSPEQAQARSNKELPASTQDWSIPVIMQEGAPLHATGVDEADLAPTRTTPARLRDALTATNKSRLLESSRSDQESDIHTPHSEETLPSWALKLMSRVQELEAQVTELKQEARLCRAGTCCHGASQLRSDESSHNRNCVSTVDSPLPKTFSAPPPALTRTNEVTEHVVCPGHGNTTTNSSDDPRKEMPEERADVFKRPGSFSSVVYNAITRKYVSRDVLQNAEDIYTEASRNLARAIQARVKEDPKKRQLTEAYDHLNQQITMNETAIDDALAYVKAIKDVDEAVATEQHGQIMELVVSINKEKERRACALAELIAYNWTGSKDALSSLLEERPSEEHQVRAKHEKLLTISSQIEQQDGVLETLEMHLNEQLQWVTGIPSDVPEVDKALRYKALRKLSKRLMKEQAAKEQLEREREELMICFLQGDDTTRKLMMDSL